MLANAIEAAVIDLLLLNQNIANLGDATGVRGSTTAGFVYVALHTDDPGEAGDQTTNEHSWTGYSRAAVARSGAGWTRTLNAVVNAALVQFNQRSDAGAAQVARFISVGFAASGASVILFRVPISGTTNVGVAFTATTADTLTAPAHALAVNDKVVCHSRAGAVLPTGITEGTVYFVKTVSGNDITLSATQGGATLDLTTAGSGVISKISELSITQNVQPQFSAGQISWRLGTP